MLDCHACLWRCLRALAHDIPPPTSFAPRNTRHRSQAFSLALTSSHYVRRRAPLVTKRAYSVPVNADAARGRGPSRLKTRDGEVAAERRDLRMDPKVYGRATAPGDVSDMTPFQAAANDAIKGTPWTQSGAARKLREQVDAGLHASKSRTLTKRPPKSLQYLKDPLALADYVRNALKKNREEEAMELVRAASKDMNCTVSWNHLIDFQLGEGRVNIAMKTYNEMKKRAQVPDSHTYVILLRGLANHAYYPQALSKAQSIYHSMSAPNSKVPPTIIHTNAVLKVCARANDLDALWGIAGRIPESGPASADNITYTTILHAIRQSALVDTPAEVPDDQATPRRNKAIVDGKRIWDEIIFRWRNGEIFVDEDLACAMGRLLLIGTRPRDWDDAFSLVEQTMNIPRLKSRLGRPTGTSYDPGNSEDQLDPFKSIVKTGAEKKLGAEGGESTSSEGKDVIPISSRALPKANMIYAKPGNNALSLVLDAALALGASRIGLEYWNLLTDRLTYGITPDLNNIHVVLRILRQSRSSAAVVEIMESDMVKRLPSLGRGTFRIAMSACLRDRNNKNVSGHANKILNLMLARLEEPDAKVCSMYADLVMGSERASDVVTALETLQPIAQNLKSMLSYGVDGGRGKLEGENREDVVEVLKRMIGLCDRLIFKGEIASEQVSKYQELKAKLASFVQRENGRSKKEGVKAKEDGGKGEQIEEASVDRRYPNDRRVKKGLVARKPMGTKARRENVHKDALHKAGL